VRGEPYLKLASIFGVSLYELMTGLSPSDSFGIDSSIEKLAQIEKLVKEIRENLNCRRS
jgi:hypothetical protein